MKCCARDDKEGAQNNKLQWLWKGLGLLIILGTTVAGVWVLTHPPLLEKIFTFIETMGLWGNLIMVGCYIFVAFPIAVGYTPLSLASGFMYGILFGSITTWVGACVIASTVSFFVCGTIAKDWVEKKVAHNKKLNAVLQAVRHNGLKIIFLIRMTPVPFGLQNALFSISGISYVYYLLGTCAGMLPEAIMWCYFGSTARRLTDIVTKKHASFGVWQKVLMGGEVVIAIIVFIMIGVIARRATQRVMNEQKKDEEAAEEASALLETLKSNEGDESKCT